ncbi:unnamed protein product [Clonostachys solani]|uniref:Rhodopsin domain-containing protein n=1 Tax=Clonostachys solani TaxID=160281 RepID=A0A9P0EF45_9HYPO|nr:unnamed protein product [Clonostachys solani]
MIELHSSTHRVFVTAVVFIVLTSTVITLRIIARVKARQFSYLSDGLCFISFLLFCAYAGVMLHYVFDIAGSDPFMPTSSLNLIEFLKVLKTTCPFQHISVILEKIGQDWDGNILYVEQVLFTFSISIVKLSILAFYWSLFGVEKKMKVAILSITTGCILWWIIFTFLAAFRCRPPTNAWKPSAPPGSCIPAPDIFLPLESTNLVLDILVLCIPVFTIGKLNLSTKKKVSVIGIFLVGVSVCVASVARIIGITKSDHAGMFFWSCMQLGLAIVCSCLPLLGALLKHKKKLSSYPRSSEYNSFRSRTGGTSAFRITENTSRAADGPWVDSAELQGKSKTQISAGNEGIRDAEYGLEPLPSNNIRVQKEISVD